MFVKGQSGNKAGRPAGAVGRATQAARENIRRFMDKSTPYVLNMWKKLKPIDQLHFYLELLPYAVPKLSAIEVDGEVKMIHQTRELPGLTDAQLQAIDEMERIALEHKDAQCKLEQPGAI
jgi:hypothetical protein